MTDERRKQSEKDKPDLSDWEPVHDSIGVTHLYKVNTANRVLCAVVREVCVVVPAACLL